MPGSLDVAPGGVSAVVRSRRPVEPSTAEEMRKALSHVYDDVAVEVDGTRVQVQVDGEESAEELHRVVEHFLSGHREVPSVIVHEGRTRSRGAEPSGGVPSGDDRLATGPGQFLQGPHWLRDLAAVRAHVTGRLGARFGLEAWQTPALIDEAVLAAAGYFAKFPHLVSTVHRLRPDYWDMVDVSRLDAADSASRRSRYAASGSALTPVTCYHAYTHAAELLDRAASDGVLHILGPVFRHEGGNHGPTRLAEFTMTELVGLGTAEQVADQHRRFLEAFIDLLEELDVEFYVSTAADPFFGADATMLRAAQLMGAAKYEVRIPIPGASDLSVGSVNRHGTTFTRAFGLSSLGVEETCCAGIGLERLAYALQVHGRLPQEGAAAMTPPGRTRPPVTPTRAATTGDDHAERT